MDGKINNLGRKKEIGESKLKIDFDPYHYLNTFIYLVRLSVYFSSIIAFEVSEYSHNTVLASLISDSAI